MRLILWQYDGWVEPLDQSLTTSPPEVSWYQPASEPVRARKPLVAEGVYVRPLEPSFVTVPASQSWYRRTSEPVRRPPELVAENRWQGILEPTFYAAIQGLGWYRETSQPVVVAAPLRTTGAAVSGPLEPRVILPAPELSWWQPASEPRRDRPQLVREGAYRRDLDQFTIDAPPEPAWLQPQAEPVRVPSPLTPHPAHAQVPYIEVRSDTWHRQQSEPARPPLPRQTAGAAEVLPPDLLGVITLDAWHVRETLPAAPKPPRPAGGLTTPPPFNAMPIYGWLYPQSEPQRQAAKATPGAFALVELREPPTPAATILPVHQGQGAARPHPPQSPASFFVHAPDDPHLDKWFSRAAEPTPARRPLVHGSAVAPPPFVVFDLVAWLQPQSEPARTVARPTPAQIVVSFVAQHVFADWLQPQSEPKFPRRQTPTGGAARVEFEETQVHGWRVPLQQAPPRAPAAFPAGIALAVTEQSLLATPGIDSWYRPASEPVRQHAPLPLEFGVLSFVRPAPPSYGFVQKAQIFG